MYVCTRMYVYAHIPQVVYEVGAILNITTNIVLEILIKEKKYLHASELPRNPEETKYKPKRKEFYRKGILHEFLKAVHQYSLTLMYKIMFSIWISTS